MIELSNLTKAYPEFTMEIDLIVERGELVSILGPSGSGKTTSLRLIAGFEQPDSGSVVVDGRDVTRRPPAERKIGYVFQDYTLFPHMNVAENIGYGLRVRRQDSTVIEARVEELLRLMELPGYGRRAVQTLSGGERQRVAIARALAVDPILLMLDEPFSSIDEVLRRDLRREIVRLQKELGITVLFVTHSRQEALSISDRVAILREGRLVQFDTPRKLYTQPSNGFVARFVGEANILHHDGQTVMLRPEQLEIRAPGNGGRPEAGGLGGVTHGRRHLAAVVEGQEFLGHSYLFVLRSTEGLLFAYHPAPIENGTEVTVVYAPDQGVAIDDA